ncbi:hypothetical protein [Asanoa hainanensis]|nr:hypothetical protein [Asanoa hainanensis]
MGPTEAFDLFTGRIGDWWPKSFTASGAALAAEGGWTQVLESYRAKAL